MTFEDFGGEIFFSPRSTRFDPIAEVRQVRDWGAFFEFERPGRSLAAEEGSVAAVIGEDHRPFSPQENRSDGKILLDKGVSVSESSLGVGVPVAYFEFEKFSVRPLERTGKYSRSLGATLVDLLLHVVCSD